MTPRKLAFAIPVAGIVIGYLLILDIANRNKTKPPFWGATDLQAQFMGLGIGHDPCPLLPPAPPPLAPTDTAAVCGWLCILKRPSRTLCDTRRSRPEVWLFKYVMWSWLFVVELCQGHASVLLVLLQALLQFSFTMNSGTNKDYDGYSYCCSSYAYFFFCASGLIAAMDATLRRRKRLRGRGWILLFGVLVGWLVSALGTLLFDSWKHNHHFLAFILGTLCALVSMLVVKEHEAFIQR